MTGKHTPGPWKQSCESIDPDWHIVTTSGGAVIANVFAPQNANARLIAAAPDLLEALLDAVDAWETHCESGDHMQGDWVYDARAAIAKARGQE